MKRKDDSRLPDTDLISNETSTILAKSVEIRVPSQELRDSNGWVRQGHRSTSVRGLPSVRLAGCRRAEVCTNGSVEVPAVEIQVILVQKAVSRDVELLRDRYTRIRKLDGIRTRTGRRRCGSSRGGGWYCSTCVESVRCGGRIAVLRGVAGRGQRGKIARQTRIVSEWIAQLQLLGTKPTIRAALSDVEIVLSLPFNNLWITILPRDAVVTS